MTRRFAIYVLLAIAAFSVTACTTPDTRFASPTIEPSARIASRYANIEVVDVTLPTYAASEQIFVEGADGAISAPGPLWADSPGRAITLQLARDLAAITGATVAPEPWPFRRYADARVDVRFEDLLATAGNTFRIAGQYFVAPEQGGGNRAGQFAIDVPLSSGGSPSDIAAARAAATTLLAEEIAASALR